MVLHCAPTDAPDMPHLSAQPPAPLNILSTPLHALIRRMPVTLPPSASIRSAAELMSAERVSSVLIVEGEAMFGLITDRDLRSRVVASGFDISRPVMDIATLAPVCVDINAFAFDALLLMAKHNVHHLPVLDGQRVVGMLTANDLTEQHSGSAVYIAGDIHKQNTIEGLQQACAKVPQVQQGLVAAGASAHSIGHIITAITDAVTVRLLQIAESQFGPPPVDYVWVAAGSQARSEQSAKTDQDNALVLDDAYDEREHGDYFKALTTFVCDGLDACGYVHCPGEMMAMNDQWRLPLSQWAELFRHWIDEPEPKALMLTCVFFDLRAVYGRAELLQTLRQGVLERTRRQSIFLAHMVGNALTHRPPLGWFGRFALERHGEHRGTMDLKHKGIVPIVDLARVCALSGGDDAVNTHERLLHAGASGLIGEKSARNLRDALAFLAATRMRHQARQIAAGQNPDNYLAPGSVSGFERSQLRDAFQVVASLQEVLAQRFQTGRL